VMIYPIILIVVTTAILSYLFTAVVPQFAKLYKELGVKLPGPTQFLTTLVVGYRYYFLGFIAAVLLTIAFAFLWSRTTRGGIQMDKIKLRVPVVGDTWIKFQMAQFSRTLATLLVGGTPLVTALHTSAEALQSRLISDSVRKASERVKEGESLHTSLASTGLMPTLALDMIEVGEASGALSPMLNSIAKFYEEETNLRISAMLSVIEPVILIFMAVVVAFILISLYLPLFSLNFSGS
jgi:type IV pilus assembly protein PilC